MNNDKLHQNTLNYISWHIKLHSNSFLHIVPPGGQVRNYEKLNFNAMFSSNVLRCSVVNLMICYLFRVERQPCKNP